MLDLHDAIILACAKQGGALASLATEQTGLSRVAVSRRLKKLADAGYLQRNGSGTRQTYSQGNSRFWLGVLQRVDILNQGGEMVVWERHVTPLISDQKPNIKSLANTAFTEMLNNALDHSQAQQVAMGVHVHDGHLQMVVADDGVGIFCHIAESAHLLSYHDQAWARLRFPAAAECVALELYRAQRPIDQTSQFARLRPE